MVEALPNCGGNGKSRPFEPFQRPKHTKTPCHLSSGGEKDDRVFCFTYI